MAEHILVVEDTIALRAKTIPILVYTAVPPQENEKKVLGMGANLYLKKPSSLDALLEAVKNLVHG